MPNAGKSSSEWGCLMCYWWEANQGNPWQSSSSKERLSPIIHNSTPLQTLHSLLLSGWSQEYQTSRKKKDLEVSHSKTPAREKWTPVYLSLCIYRWLWGPRSYEWTLHKTMHRIPLWGSSNTSRCKQHTVRGQAQGEFSCFGSPLLWNRE